MSYNFTEKELKLLNSNLALQLLLQQPKLDPRKVLRQVKFEKEIEKLQIELIKLQRWVIENNKRVCILFEGRDAAGKGGAIRRITHHLNPRNYKIVALPKPTRIEQGQWYFQRYVNKLPNPGEIVLFDRSWYNRAVLEPVNGFCTQKQYEHFMKEVVSFEEMLLSDGIILIKFYFSITKEEQEKRFKEIQENPLKRWKMSPIDDVEQKLWDEYTSYKNEMFAKTSSETNPWIIVEANRKSKARTVAILHILETIPYNK